MEEILKRPPASKDQLTSPQDLAKKLQTLINRPFKLSGKPRTDGANLRKLIGSILATDSPPSAATSGDFKIIPPRKKGVPKILLEYIDTYVVSTGVSYNLQVWNRNPDSQSVQIEYDEGTQLNSSEIRFVLAKVDATLNIITGIVVLTPDYIVKKFGQFGRPTVKNQLMISQHSREKILENTGGLLFFDEAEQVGNPDNIRNLSNYSIHDEPTHESLLPISTIRDIVAKQIIGQTISPGATKNRGQVLESLFLKSFGYKMRGSGLIGGYPDIRNQALEVKVQDAQTVDLGLYSPEFLESVPKCGGFNTRNMRYFIAFTNPASGIIEGGVLCTGDKLGRYFTYVSEKSYKCQRTIPMTFFQGINGKSVFNP